MSHLRHVLTVGLLCCAAALSGCLFLGDDEPGDDVACPAIFELCPEGSAQVEACAPGARCVNKNTCGGGAGTICQYEDDAQCKALPVCEEGEVELGRCGPSELCAYECAPGATCRSASLCGQTVFCQREEVNCRAIPTCPEGTTQVETCRAGASCAEHTLCGTTILCAEEVVTCDAVPSCPADAVQVDACNDLYICSTVTLCGQTIQCEHREVQCDAYPVCPAGTVEVPACAEGDTRCKYVTNCGGTIACQEEQVDCLAVPVCPAGGQQVMACQVNAAVECQQVSLCGQTITCQFALGCAPQDARGEGLCAAFFGYAWDGAACVGLGGCSCVGDDCDQTYATPEACQQARSFCQP